MGEHTCSDWTSSDRQTASSVGFGDPVSTGTWSGWCFTGDDVCSKLAAIYCFQQ
jgi:hypothetical protein